MTANKNWIELSSPLRTETEKGVYSAAYYLKDIAQKGGIDPDDWQNFQKKTLLGKAVRAATEDMGAATLLGISPRRVGGVTFAIGIALAGVAGVATAITYPFDPYFGFIFSLKALIAVAFGGLGSVGGALLGGILLGVIESVGSYMISGGWADAISYAAFLLVLMFRPEGLFGRSAA